MINKYMKLSEIREHLIKNQLNKPNCRDVTRQFLVGMSSQYQVALTLTLKQKWFNKNGQMRIEHYLTKEDVPKIYERFEYKLNKLVWKHKYYRHKEEGIRFLKAWEDGQGSKRIHLHAALGNFPKKFKFNTLPKLIEKAASECYEIDIEHDEQICDSGWIEYITKEVGKDNTDKILW